MFATFDGSVLNHNRILPQYFDQIERTTKWLGELFWDKDVALERLNGKQVC